LFAKRKKTKKQKEDYKEIKPTNEEGRKNVCSTAVSRKGREREGGREGRREEGGEKNKEGGGAEELGVSE
jgi:hypothetical protein